MNERRLHSGWTTTEFSPTNQSLRVRVRVRVILRLAVYRQSVRLGDKPLETNDTVISFFNWTLAVHSLCNILSDERMGLSFTITAGPHQRSHFQVRVPRNSRPHFTVSDSILAQPGGPGPHIYIPRNRVARLYPQALGFLFVTFYDSQGYGGGIRSRLHTVDFVF
jgi:hypothetical protein